MPEETTAPAVSSDLTFLTNEPGETLRDRLGVLLTKDTQFFDCLVGYFFISGFYRLYPALENVEKVRILVGLKTDRTAYELLERAKEDGQLGLFQLSCTTADGKNVSADGFSAWRGLAVRAVPCLSGNRNGLDSLQRGSGAHARNGRDPAVDQEVCPDDVRRIVRREVNCQLRDFQRIGHPLAWIVGAENVFNRIALLFAWKATEHRRVRRAWAQGIHANPTVHEFGAEDSSEMADRGLAGRDGRGCRPPLARANGRSDDYRRALPEQRQGLLNREVNPFEIDGYHLVEALLCHVLEQQELAVTCIYEDAVQVPELPLDHGEHPVEVAEIADVRANGETSGPKRLLSRLQRPLIQAADGDARALSVEFLRSGQPDPAVAAGDKDILVR